MTMFMVNVNEVKAKFSEYLEKALSGETVLVCKRNRPVAELRAIASAAGPRRIGGAAGRFDVPDSFFAPLPEDVAEGFYPPEGTKPSRAADPAPAPYGRTSKTPPRKGRR